MDKQVNQIAIEHPDFTSGNVDIDSDGTNERYEINISDMDITIDPEFYTGDAYNKAISGRLRHNLRGLRTKVTINYDSSLENNLLRNLTNDIVGTLTQAGNDSITFYPDASKGDSFEVVLEDGYSLLTAYSDTIGNFEPTLEFIALEEVTSIPSYLEAP